MLFVLLNLKYHTQSGKCVLVPNVLLMWFWNLNQLSWRIEQKCVYFCILTTWPCMFKVLFSLLDQTSMAAMLLDPVLFKGHYFSCKKEQTQGFFNQKQNNFITISSKFSKILEFEKIFFRLCHFVRFMLIMMN